MAPERFSPPQPRLAHDEVNTPMLIGTVGELWRYPVKSMGGERLDGCPVGVAGLLGDRGWVVRCEMSTARCEMTVQAQAALPKDPTVLRTIVREAGQQLGIYASVLQPGRVAAGDVAA
jgi:uncharacterized protein YcbX